jgi:multimeric flavodoxin WrbA
MGGAVMETKKLLGVVASYRRIGNSEIVVKAVAELLSPRWELSLVRLPQLRILPCKGCFACLVPNKDCNLEDDVGWLLDRLRESDGIVFASPNYLMGPVGFVKMLADRSFQAYKYFDILREKRTAVALTLGSEEYRGYSDTVLASQVSSLGLKIVSLECFYGRRPGSCVMVKDFEEKIGRLARSIEGEKNAELPQPNRCPYCRSDLFRIRAEGIECAICKSLADIDGNKLTFLSQNPEFTQAGKIKHRNKLLSEKEQPDSIKAQLKEIQYRYRDGNWLTPIA